MPGQIGSQGNLPAINDGPGVLPIWSRRTRKQIEASASAALRSPVAAKHLRAHRRRDGERKYADTLRRRRRETSQQQLALPLLQHSSRPATPISAGAGVRPTTACCRVGPASGWGTRTQLSPAARGTVVVAPKSDSRFGACYLVDFHDRRIWLDHRELHPLRSPPPQSLLDSTPLTEAGDLDVAVVSPSRPAAGSSSGGGGGGSSTSASGISSAKRSVSPDPRRLAPSSSPVHEQPDSPNHPSGGVNGAVTFVLGVGDHQNQEKGKQPPAAPTIQALS
jgi:hypothetical protein